MSENTTDGSTLHLLPADAYPGLLDGWVGPVEVRIERKDVSSSGAWFDASTEKWGAIHAYTDTHGYYASLSSAVRLDLHRPECIDRVVRVLAAGVRCPSSSHPAPDYERGTAHCICKGTGYLIQPADLSWARDLPPWQAGPILAASVLRVVAGEAPVQQYRDRAAVPPWRGGPYAQFADSRGCDGFVSIGRLDRDVYTRRWCGAGAAGPRTADDAQDRASADAAVLRAGFALDNGDHILIPTVGGKVARVEAP